jgi:hypothetical protein
MYAKWEDLEYCGAMTTMWNTSQEYQADSSHLL